MELRKLRDKATEAFTKGRFAKSAELYEDYCAKDPKDIQARLRMGDAWNKAGERHKAIGAYKSAAEAFAREGFLPRAIAASKLILELDPTHQGVQQMLAGLYARKGGAPRARPPAAPLSSARHAPIELAEDPEPLQSAEPALLSNRRAPIELPEEPAALRVSAGPSPAPDFGGGSAHHSELPPELQLHAEPAAPAPAAALELHVEAEAAVPAAAVTSADLPLELHVEAEAPVPAAGPAADAAPLDLHAEPEPGLNVPSPAADAAPPGLRRRTADTIPSPWPMHELRAPEVPAAVPAEPRRDEPPAPAAQPPEPSPILAASAGAAVAAASRIWLPGAAPAPEAPVKNELVHPPGQSPAGGRDLERAFSRFDELSLDDAPVAPRPAEPAPRLPSFTELELDGDSLLHAVEVAAQAGCTQRGEEVADDDDDEEEVFSLTAEVGLPRIPLFSDLPPDAFIELFDRCPLRHYAQGERILRQGSVGDAFYVVCEGEVKVVRDEPEGPRELATLRDGAFFGEMALLSGAPRSASVDSAADDTQLLEISAPVLAQLSLRFPAVARALKRFCRQRMLANVLASSPLFRPFSQRDRKDLVAKFRARDVEKGARLISEGSETDGLYVVLSGEVEVTSGEQVLARLREGELFGEMSLLHKTPATATVRATRHTSLLRLPRQDFDALIVTHPQILMLISELTDHRQRATEALLSGSAELGEEGLLLV